jgi:Synergist-CTERM protein sorting domain-containing protein
LSKKRFILFALVAAIVLSFAGSAFAAPANKVVTFDWTTTGGGSWGDPNNWRVGTGIPPVAPVREFSTADETAFDGVFDPSVVNDGDTARVVIPANAGTITIPARTIVAVEQISVTGTADPNTVVEINIGDNAVLVIQSKNILATSIGSLPSVLQLDADANVKFTGNGRVVLVTGDTYYYDANNQYIRGAVAEYRVRGNATVDFQVKVDSPAGDTTPTFPVSTTVAADLTDGLYGYSFGNGTTTWTDPIQVIKTDTGKLYFTGAAANEFAGRTSSLDVLSVANVFQFLVQDGEVGLGDPTNFTGPDGGLRRVNFSDFNVVGRTPTFTALWSGAQSVGTHFQLTAEDKYGSSGAGTINVAQADGVLRITNSGTNAVGTINGTCITGPDYDGAINKTGPGTLRLSVENSVIDKIGYLGVQEGTLRISASGGLYNGGLANVNAFFDNEYFYFGRVNVYIADGATMRVDAEVIENVDGFSGAVGSTTTIEETARLNTWGGGTYEGQITGSGTIGIVSGALEITGEQNDFSGDTHVSRDGTVVINNAKNLGGTRENTIYLEADNTADVGHVIGSRADRGGLLEVAEGAGNLVLPNRIYLGNGIKVLTPTGNTASDVDRNRNVGEARIRVWKGDRLELPSNIQYNANTIFKYGEGEMYLTDLGYDSTGANTFTISLAAGPNNTTVALSPPTITTALRIFNGLVRIENRYAVDHGDIITDAGQQPARRPVLSIGNGIEFQNHLLFTDASVLATELKTENLASGTNVQAAIGTGFFSTPTDRTEVRVRVAFSELEGGLVKKGDNFQLVKAQQFIRVDENMVVPEQWDVMGSTEKAPFDVRLSASGILFFEANTNIDVPQIGTPNVTEVAFGEDYTIRIPVGTTTGLLENSAELSGPLYTSGAKIAISGNDLVITGKAPAAASEDITLTYNVAVTSKTDRTSDTLGYANYKEGFTLRATENPGSAPVATGPNVTAPLTLDVEGQKLTGKISYEVDSVATAASATVTLYKGAVEDANVLTAITDAVITATDGYDLSIEASAVSADFAFERDTTYTVTVAIAGSDHAPWVFTASEATPTTPPVTGGGSGGGCDAGFGVFALLAATGAVTLLRKKG